MTAAILSVGVPEGNTLSNAEFLERGDIRLCSRDDETLRLLGSWAATQDEPTTARLTEQS